MTVVPAPLLLALLVGAAPQPLLPQHARRFYPAQVEVAGDGVVRGAELRDVQTCGGCHQDAVAQWRTSAHAFASFNNPLYRVSVERVREGAGRAASRMCAGCHDVALLVEGAMDAPVAPEDQRAHAAITCQTCHGIVATRRLGNGSYTLATRDVALPGDDARSIAEHKAQVAPPLLRTAELCGTCHRSFLDRDTGNAATFFGMDEYTPWSRSEFAGNHADRVDPGVAPRTCQGCHMPREPALLGDAGAKEGRIASHRFLGGHTYLAAMRGDADRLARNQAFLRGVATLDVPAIRRAGGEWVFPAEGAPVRPGERFSFDVVVRNRQVGHAFPGGVQDAQDTWVDVELRDAAGRVLGHDAEHHLRAEVLDAGGKPISTRDTHRFLTAAWNHTVPPRDATACRFETAVPLDARFPLRVVARLLHRSRNLDLQRLACEDHRGRSGQAFAAVSLRLNGAALDPCVEQPVTEIDRAEVELGAGARSGLHAEALAERLYAHGMALSKSFQEDLDEARAPLGRALELVGTDQPAARGRILVELARVAVRQGRADEALAHLDAAAARNVLPEAAVDCLRAEAQSSVWRWPEAVEAATRCARNAPGDLQAWRQLALALGSGGRAGASLAAAGAGLRLHPLDPTLLRVQALALRALGAPPALVDAADQEFLERRFPDDAPRARGACSAQVPGCAAERNPVPVRVLAPERPGGPPTRGP